MWYIYNGIPLNHKKRSSISIVTTWIDLENIILRKKDRKNQEPYDITHMEQKTESNKGTNKKNKLKNIIGTDSIMVVTRVKGQQEAGKR